MKEFIKKEKINNLLLFILIFFSVLSTLIIKDLGNLDEIWHYNFGKNIADGLIPYKDFNIVVTPLLAILSGIILKFTYYQVFVMRILAALIYSLIFYITYKLFNILNIKKKVSIIFTYAIAYLFKDILCIDYNVVTLLIVLIIIYIEIKLYKRDFEFIKCNPKLDMLLGILAGLAITTKQTSGLVICVVTLGNKFLFISKKEEVVNVFKSFIYRFVGVFVPVLLMILYLIFNNAFREFLNYAILGIFEFTNKIPYNKLMRVDLIGLLSIAVPVIFIYAFVKTIVLKKDRIMYIILIYGLAIFILVFPISSKGHFLVASLPTIVLILYIIYSLLEKKIKGRIRKIVKMIVIYFSMVIVLFLIYYSAYNLYVYITKNESYSILEHYSYIPIDKNLEENIEIVDEYIEKNKNVKILDTSAAIYMVPINKYNKYYDMFNNGNFGINGEERIIEEISNSEDTIYLILNDKYPKNWQMPINIINYVKTNLVKNGEIGIFDIYIKGENNEIKN